MSRKSIVDLTKLVLGKRPLARNKLSGLWDDQKKAWHGDPNKKSGIYACSNLFQSIAFESNTMDDHYPYLKITSRFDMRAPALSLNLPGAPVIFSVAASSNIAGKGIMREAHLSELLATMRMTTLEGLIRAFAHNEKLVAYCEKYLAKGCDTLLSLAIALSPQPENRIAIEKFFHQSNEKFKKIARQNLGVDDSTRRLWVYGESSQDISPFVITVSDPANYTFIQFKNDLKKSLSLSDLNTTLVFSNMRSQDSSSLNIPSLLQIQGEMLEVFEEDTFYSLRESLIKKEFCLVTASGVTQHSKLNVVAQSSDGGLQESHLLPPRPTDSGGSLAVWASGAAAAYLGAGISAGAAFCFYPPINAMIMPLFKSAAVVQPEVFTLVLCLGALLLALGAMMTYECVIKGEKPSKGNGFKVKSKIFNKEAYDRMIGSDKSGCAL